jgi:hypothetical protein
MKNNLRRAKRFIEIFGEDNIYDIHISSHSISIQCYFHADMVMKAQKLNFSHRISDNGFLHMERGVFDICLTQKV